MQFLTVLTDQAPVRLATNPGQTAQIPSGAIASPANPSHMTRNPHHWSRS